MRDRALSSFTRTATIFTSTKIMPLAFQVANLQIKAPTTGENGYQGFNPRKETLPKGWQSRDGARALSEDMVVEHDVAVKVRDGCTLYCDIYRPNNSDAKIPAIVAWSPFGKKHTGIDMMSHVKQLRRHLQVFTNKDTGEMGLRRTQGLPQWSRAIRRSRSGRVLPTWLRSRERGRKRCR
jgi:hypothetical protein